MQKMKIRTKDGKRYLEFEEVYAEEFGHAGQAAVFAINQNHKSPVCIGVYGDMNRARGVLYEIDLAYQSGQKVFYAPAE